MTYTKTDMSAKHICVSSTSHHHLLIISLERRSPFCFVVAVVTVDL